MKKKNKLEIFFYISYVIFLFSLLVNSTKYNFVPEALKVSHIFQIVGCVLAIIKILFDVYQIYKHKTKYKFDYKWILFFILICIVVFVSKSKTLAYLAIFVLANKDIDFNKVLKLTLYTLLFTLVFTISSNKLGFIPEVLVYREDGLVRHSYGFTSPNVLMIILFEIISIYLYLRKDKYNLLDIIGSLVLILIGYYFTNSRIALLATIILLVLFLLLKYTKIKILFDKLKILTYIFPCFLAISFLILTYLYESYNLTKLDTFFTGRLYFTNESIKENGIHLFGKEVIFTGQRAEGEQVELKYNYVDCSYIKILINYGILILIAVLILLIILTKQSYKDKNYILLVILLTIEFYCFFDSYLICIEFNPFLYLLCNKIYPIKLKS